MFYSEKPYISSCLLHKVIGLSVIVLISLINCAEYNTLDSDRYQTTTLRDTTKRETTLRATTPRLQTPTEQPPPPAIDVRIIQLLIYLISRVNVKHGFTLYRVNVFSTYFG